MLQLLILGFLYREDLHPYEVTQIIKDRSMDSYVKINHGTLYYNFEQLLKRGDIEVKEVIHEAKRPDKTIYRITEQGRAHFEKLLHQQFSDETPMYHPLYPALMFAGFGEESLIRAAMEHRRERMQANIATLHDVIAEHEGHIPWSSVHIMRGNLMHFQAELAWVESFLEQLDRYGLDTGGTTC